MLPLKTNDDKKRDPRLPADGDADGLVAKCVSRIPCHVLTRTV